MVTMLASEIHGRLGVMLQSCISVLSGGSAAARRPIVNVVVRRSGELTCFPFRTRCTTSPLPLSFLCKSKTGADVAVGELSAGTAAESHPPSVFLRDSSGLETGMRGIADVLGNARSLDYSIERLGENEQQTGSGRESALDWKTDGRIARSCEAGISLRVAVLVSGGVDSSVALRLLCEAGHSCTAFYLKIWFQEDFENFWSSCPWEEDLSFAQAVCDEAGVELKLVHLTDAYWGKVVSKSISEIRAGRTPNPDMLCNSMIKFGWSKEQLGTNILMTRNQIYDDVVKREFLEHIKDENFDRIASGHYARVNRVADSYGGHVLQLLLSADEMARNARFKLRRAESIKEHYLALAKDQTYFLSQLSQSQLSRLSFPLGELTKVEVRGVALAMGLSNNQRKDSQGICFLGKVKFSEFIARHLGEQEGCLLEAESGELLGRHKGFWFYTIGQRHGIRLSNGPWFVVAKDVEHNVVFVSREYFNQKRRRSFWVGSFNWASGSRPSNLESLRCKVRHGPKFYNCTMNFNCSDLLETTWTAEIALLDDKFSTAVVNLAEDDQGLAPGQYAAFYQNDVCLGSGIIFEALGEEKALNVSVKALAAAEICNTPEFLRDHNGAKKETGSNPKKDRAAVPSAQDKSLGSNWRSVGRKYENEGYRNSQSTELLTEKHIKQSDAVLLINGPEVKSTVEDRHSIFQLPPRGNRSLASKSAKLNFRDEQITGQHPFMLGRPAQAVNKHD